MSGISRWVLMIVWLATGGALFAQVTAPKYSNEFLQIPAGARAQGMGGAISAIAHGPEAGVWNPASLHELKSTHNIALMHSEYFGGVSAFDYLSYATALDSGSAIGFSFLRLGVDDIPDTRFLYDANGRINYDNISLFSAADYALIVSFARKLKRFNDLEFGGNAKVIHRKAGRFARSWGFGIDLAVNYSYGNWKLSAVGKDVTGTFNAWSHSEELVAEVYNSTGNTLNSNSVELTLPKLIIGLARTIYEKESFNLVGSLDMQMFFDGRRNSLLRTGLMSVDPVLGFESTYKQKLHFRTGMSGAQIADDRWRVNPHLGLGFDLPLFSIDYGFSRNNGLQEGLFTHSFSLNFAIDD